MDLESASELLQEKAKIRDDEIVQIQAAYDTEIQLLQSKLSTCKEEDRAYYEEQIANLEQDKQKKITEQRDLYDEYLRIIEEYNPKLLEGISDLNGQILTGEEERNAEYLQKVQERYAGLEQITESGCYTLYNMEKAQMRISWSIMIRQQGRLSVSTTKHLEHLLDIRKKSKLRRWRWH